MRISNSIKNITVSIISQVIMIILGFISRKVFIDNLGIEYLGINGLLTNVLSLLALVEGGIGMSIIYNLYKPLAENNKEKVIALVQLYRKVYTVLALIILLLSFSIYPFLGAFIKEGENISNIEIIFSIFVLKNLISYLNAHKWSLISADQKGYVIRSTELLFQIITTILKIVVLVTTENYILYLLIELFIFFIQNVVNGQIINRRYPYIKTKVKYIIDKETKENIVTNVKALFLHNIGGFFVFGTDNILISSFISVATVGIYSNYTMIIGQLSSLSSQVLGGIGASVGNLIATEDSSKNYSVFKTTFFISFWIYSLGVTILYIMLEPFISWWLGGEYLFSHIVLIIILINFYLTGMRTAISMFKNKAGLFVQDKYAPLVEGGINLIISVILLKYFGLAGIFLGTIISTLSTVFWLQPYIVYKKLFNKPVKTYFKRYVYYFILTIISCSITSYICNGLIKNDDLYSLIQMGLLSLIIPNIFYFLVFHKSKEFQEVVKIIKNILKIKVRSSTKVKAS